MQNTDTTSPEQAAADAELLEQHHQLQQRNPIAAAQHLFANFHAIRRAKNARKEATS